MDSLPADLDKGSPRILEWVAYPFSRGSSWPRNQTRVSCSGGRFFTNWAMREASAIHHPKSATGIHMSPPSFQSPPSIVPHPTPPGHRTLAGASSKFASSKFPLAICFKYGDIYVSILSQFISLLPSLCSRVCFLCLWFLLQTFLLCVWYSTLPMHRHWLLSRKITKII